MAVAAMLFILGNHDGAFRIYWVQLVTPFLLLTVLSGLARSGGRIRALALGLLAVNVVILLTWMRPPWPQDSAPAWQAWQTLTAGKPWQLLPYGMLPDVPRPAPPWWITARPVTLPILRWSNCARTTPPTCA